MALIDILVIGAICLFTLLGLRGMSGKLFAIFLVIVNIYLTIKFYDPVSQCLRSLGLPQSLTTFIGCVLIFVLALACTRLIAIELAKMLDKLNLSFIDKLTGALAGFLVALFLINLISQYIPQEKFHDCPIANKIRGIHIIRIWKNE